MRAIFILGLPVFVLQFGCADLRSWQATQQVATKPPPTTAPVLSIDAPPLKLAAAQSVPPLQQVTTPEPAPAASDDPMMKLRQIHRKASERLATMDTYTFRLRRREFVNNAQRPEELMLVKFRREPWSVYFKWLGNEAKGREVLYVKDRYENQIHTLTAAGDIPLMPGGKHIRVPVDSLLAKSRSRHPITEAGLGGVIDHFGNLLDKIERGDPRAGTVKYLGQIKRPEFDKNVHAILQSIPPENKHLPKGGQRMVCFDLESHLPVLIITQDETGREVEYYCHDRIQHPVALDDDDFNPDVLWKKK